MSELVDLINRNTPLVPPFGRLAVIAMLFALAWLLSRLAGRIAEMVVRRGERKQALDVADTGVIANLRQRETAISLGRTTIGFTAFGFATLLSFGVLVGADRVQTIAGASFVLILLAFGAQRFLMDAIAGLLMFHERWFRIGDTVVIEPWKIQGVVEDVTVRSVSVRSVTGELMRVSNSEVKAVRVLPRGFREAEIELFVTDAEQGAELLRRTARMVPIGPTHFVRRPTLVESVALEDNLHLLRATTAVPLGREWLAEELLPGLLQESAAEGLVVHGPVVMWSDEQAVHRFARAARTPVEPGRARSQADLHAR